MSTGDPQKTDPAGVPPAEDAARTARHEVVLATLGGTGRGRRPKRWRRPLLTLACVALVVSAVVWVLVTQAR